MNRHFSKEGIQMTNKNAKSVKHTNNHRNSKYKSKSQLCITSWLFTAKLLSLSTNKTPRNKYW